MVRGILFDFGGTLDTGGDHWFHILYDIIEQMAAELTPALQAPLDKQLYKQAFAFGERTLATKPIISPDFNFYDVLFEKVQIQLDFIRRQENNDIQNKAFFSKQFAEVVAGAANQFAADNCTRHAAVINELKLSYQVGLVSNFYGNIQTVLKDFDILPLFEIIIESAVAGVKKPDPAIFTLGCEALGLLPKECLVVGDSLVKDIRPAISIGCKAFWLEGRGWDASSSLNPLQDITTEFPAGQFARIGQLEEIAGMIN